MRISSLLNYMIPFEISASYHHFILKMNNTSYASRETTSAISVA